MPSTIYLITGGCRSGKSGYAQSMCEKLCPNPIYLATSSPQVSDKDFEERVKRHQDDRGPTWTTIEEPLKLTKHNGEQFSNRVIMIDCLTLWLTNYFMDEGVFCLESSSSEAGADTGAAANRALEAIKKEFDELTKQWDATFFIVTNEIGSGTHADNPVSRRFVDAQGWLNQHVAAKAYSVVHMVSGIPNVIKVSVPRVPATNQPSKDARDEAIMVDKILSTRGIEMESKGYFMIKLEGGLIVASFISCITNDKGEVCDLQGNKISCCSGTKKREPMVQWKCRTAKELTTEIFERWEHVNDVVSKVGHAAYIGREAQRAEHCLFAGEHYQQD